MMALKIQVVVMDGKDYIIEHKNFGISQMYQVLDYVKKQIMDVETVKIHIRKW